MESAGRVAIRSKCRSAWRAGIVLCLLATPLLALDPAVPLARLGVASWRPETGDPLGAVSVVMMSSTGYLWLGTEEGAARFDGVRFEVYDVRRTAGLTDDDVMSMLEARDGRIWLGTSAGLFRLEANEVTPRAEKILDAPIIWGLAQGPDGCVWAATMQGLLRWAGAGGRRVGPNVRALAVAVAPDGTVAAGYRDGLRVWPGGRLREAPRHLFHDETVAAVTIGKDGAIWLGSTAGVRRLVEDRVELVLPRRALDGSAFTGAIYVDAYGAVWLATETGIYRWHDARLERLSASDGLPASRVGAIAEDNEGSLWVGTQAGLARLREERLANYGARDGLEDEKIWSVLTDRAGALWAASVEGRVFRKDPDRERFEQVGTLGSPPTSHTIDREGALWYGTLSSGLVRIRGRRFERLGPPAERIQSVLADRDGALWVAAGRAGALERRVGSRIERFDGATGLTTAPILSMYQDREGVLWFGSYGGGLSSYHDGVFRTFRTQDGLGHDLVVSIQEIGGELLVGTASGITRVRGDRLVSIDWHAGLPTAGAQRIGEDRFGRLWIGTNKGLVTASRSDLEAVFDGRQARLETRTFGIADGMGSPECNSGHWGLAVTPDGRMWFATMKGVTVVDPGRIFVNREAPPATIERAVLDGRETAVDGALEIPAGTDRLEIHYTGLALRDPERLRFRYRLEGFDRDWVDAQARRVAYYTNLRPGRYVFQVGAINEDGFASVRAATLPLRLAPLVHQTPWFWGALGVAAFAAAAILHRRRVGQLAARERLRTALAEARLNALLLQLRPHFLFNTLHTILPLIEVNPRRASVMVVKLGALLRASLRNDASQLVPLEEELLLLDQYIEIEKARFGRRLEVELDVEAGTENARVPIFLFQPLVENAIKHALAPGRTLHVLVRARREADRLRLEIVDDGRVGQDAARPRPAGGVGLSNTRERLEKLFPERHEFLAGPGAAGGFAVSVGIPFERDAAAHAADIEEVRHVASYADRR